MKKLHICHISSVHTTTDTRVFYRECLSLAKHFKVTLIAIGNQNANKEGVECIALPKPSNRVKRLLLTTLHVYQAAKKIQADVYHFHDPELIPYALLLKWQGKKVVYDLHENVTESLKAKSWLPLKWLFIQMYLLFDKLAAANFELILAEDAYVAVYQKRYPHKNTTIVRNFAPTELLLAYRKSKRDDLPFNIFYMGSIDQLYCIEPMLHAILLLKQKGYSPLLKLVGWVSPKVQGYIKSLPYYTQIEPNLEFLGYQDIKQGYALSIDCSIGFSFVSDNINVKESLPRKMFEYMQIGLPVISSGYKTYQNMVETHQTGLCVKESNAASIADATEQLWNNKEMLNRFAENSINAANASYNWEYESVKLIDFYHSLSHW
ncbi:MAG: glycosyltransferase [Bacteroidota bacterium]|nr:glycosyltransferase [Sphingobacteriales bacterium]